MDKQNLPALEGNQYYWHQLEGMFVYSSQEEPPVLLGAVARMMATGANDVMVVQACENSLDDRERLLPFSADAFDTSVDLEKRIITLDWDPQF